MHWLVFEKYVRTDVYTKVDKSPLALAGQALQVDAMAWLVSVGAGTLDEAELPREVLELALTAALQQHAASLGDRALWNPDGSDDVNEDAR